VAKIALAVGFGVLGAFTGGLGWFGLAASAGHALLGFSLGMAAGQILGNVLMPIHTTTTGPRVGDLTVSSAANGSPIPIGYGMYRIAGQVIWSPGLVETSKTTKTGGKGGPSNKSTSYTYSASFAIAFGESFGTSTATRFGDVLKVWFDSKVVFGTKNSWQNNHVYQIGDQIVDSNGNIQTVSLIVIDARSGNSAPTWSTSGTTTDGHVTWTESAPPTTAYPLPTIYHGTETQNPDPLIQGTQGVANTPAFRGLIYAVWENFPLADFGSRIPNVQALVKYGQTQPAPLGDVITDICIRAGIPAANIDVSQLAQGPTATLTVPGTAHPWDPTLPANSAYDFGNHLGSAPVTAAVGLVAGQKVSVAWLSGTVSSGAAGSGWDFFDANGGPYAQGGGQVRQANLQPQPDGTLTGAVSLTGVVAGSLLCVGGMGHGGVPSDPGSLPSDNHGTSYASTGLTSGGVINTFIGIAPVSGNYTITITFWQGIQSDGTHGEPTAVAFAFEIPKCTALDHQSFTGAIDVGSTSAAVTPSFDQQAVVMAFYGDTSGSKTLGVPDYPQGLAMSVTGATGLQDGTAITASSGTSAGWATGMIGHATAVKGGTAVIAGVSVTTVVSSVEGIAAAALSFSAPHDPLPGLPNVFPLTYIPGYSSTTLGIAGLMGAFVDDSGKVIQPVVVGDGATLTVPVGATKLLLGINDNIPQDNQGSFSVAVSTNLTTPSTITGYVLSMQVDAKTALQNILNAYFLDAVETNYKLTFVPRGLNPAVLTIPENDLGLVSDQAEIQEQIAMAQDLPREVEILFIDPSIDWQQNKTHKHRHRRGGHSKQLVQMQLPMAFTPTEALQIAEKALYLAHLESKTFAINLWKSTYMQLDPTDNVNFVFEGQTFTGRLVHAAIGVDFSVQTSMVSGLGASNYLSTPTGAVAQAITPATARPAVPTVMFLADLPYLQDSDAVADRSTTGLYVSMSSTDPSWVGGILEISSDNTAFSPIASDANRMAYGTVTSGPLPAPPRLWTWDTVNALTVQMSNGTLSGSTDLDVLNGHNALLVGGELIQYVNCVQGSPGVYTLSRLLRGRRNTEYACGTHVANETAIDPGTGILRQSESLALIGALRFYKGVTIGADPSTATSQSLTLAPNDLKPASPCHVAATKDGSGNITISWIRRTRYAGDWLNNTGAVPLNEDFESYDVEIWSGGSVVRTFSSVTSTALAYTAAQQTTDFGAPQSTLHVKVYQLSKQVARGQVSDNVGLPVIPAGSGGGGTGGSGTTSSSSVVQKYAQTIGDGTTTTFTISHNLGNTDVVVRVFELTGALRVAEPEIQNVDINNVKVIFAVAPAANSYRVIVEG
jgi:hypothetical protein